VGGRRRSASLSGGSGMEEMERNDGRPHRKNKARFGRDRIVGNSSGVEDDRLVLADSVELD